MPSGTLEPFAVGAVEASGEAVGTTPATSVAAAVSISSHLLALALPCTDPATAAIPVVQLDSKLKC